MPIVKISAKGQVVIPKEIREKPGITPGKKVLFRIAGKHGEITPIPDDSIKALRGIFKGGTSMATELLDERKGETLKESG